MRNQIKLLNFKHTMPAKKSRGFTTVELLVGLLLSIFIIGISTTYFISSSRTFRFNTNESVVQENGRFALEYLASALRHAGVNPSNALEHEMHTVYAGAICHAQEGSVTSGTGGGTVCTRDGANDANQNNSDRVAIDYILDATRQTTDFAAVGCNGASLTVPAGQDLHVASVYWTADIDGDGVRSLYCQTMNLETNVAVGAALPIVDGIERLQVQYGVDDDENGVVERYVSFTNLGAANTDKVRSMRLSMLVASSLVREEAKTEQLEADAQKFKLLDGTLEEFAVDDVYRQVFSTTVMVHNVTTDVFAETL